MIEGVVFHKFSRTWKEPYHQRCETCGERFVSTARNKKYCSYACTPNKSRPIPQEDGLVLMKIKYTCSECGIRTIETLMVSNKSRGIDYLRCRDCAGGSHARV